jgi:ribulose-5-phosphate 4-epimerase/fuculose-1-phosphate aldolase
MTENQAREEICRVGRSLFERGYVHATAGNISIRLDDGYLITPTDACLGWLDPAALAKTDPHLAPISGERPSKALALHARIYTAAQTAATCIVHTHSTHCVALTLSAPAEELLPPIAPYFVMKVGRVPVIPYRAPGDIQTAALVEQTIRRYHARGLSLRAVMLERLGPNVWDSTPARAMAVLEELEETAKLVVMAKSLPGEAAPPCLTTLQIEQLRTQFNASW